MTLTIIAYDRWLARAACAVHLLFILAAVYTPAFAVGQTEQDGKNTLTYSKPAQNWAAEALPIGNGRMGAMLFGGIAHEHIQFNEQSLWSGANNWDGDYNQGPLGFGNYQNFGDLLINWDVGLPVLSSPTGQAAGNGQPIENTVDGNPATKWCIENPGAAVMWQAQLPAPREVKSYSFTSGELVASRDPQLWVLEGSMDGIHWMELDRRDLGKPFEERGQTKTFQIAHPQAVRYYRFTFTPKDSTHFQVSEVSLEGVSMAAGVPPDYRRSLNLKTGLQTTRFTLDGITYMRESFASHPDQVMVFHYTASSLGALSGNMVLKSAQGAVTEGDPCGLSFAGEMVNKLKYACVVRVLHTGGTVRTEGGVLKFENCDSLTVLMDARTNYKEDYNAGWRGPDPKPVAEAEIAAAQSKPYTVLCSAHVNDLSGLLGRVTLDLGATDPALAALPTDGRLKNYVAGGSDPGLEVQMFEMGRYLLASSSRPGGLPANLQGLWNEENSSSWSCDYHNNINVQMNYWGAETTNLSECQAPLVDFIVASEEPCRIATRKAFGEQTRGWTARTSQNIFGGNGWEWNIPASAWYAQHVFEHWAFTQDQTYLRNTAYPILKEICQFWEDRLKRMPDGSLMAPNGWSPEHGPREDGVMMDQQIVWDLFQNYREAAAALGVDADYQRKVADMQTHLAPNKIGKWGQLQEWQTDRDDPNDGHRHNSHLFAVYPGRQISFARTLELAAAARISLMARSGDKSEKGGPAFTIESTPEASRLSFVWVWRCALWARLLDGERADLMVRGRLAVQSYPNLICSYEPVPNNLTLLEMDGNFGITAAMAEMLLQSQTGVIDLLPALPKAWAAQGSFTGLRARGGYTVDCAWRNGQVTSLHFRGAARGAIPVRVNGKVWQVTPEPL